jgi:hypothetical protein
VRSLSRLKLRPYDLSGACERDGELPGVKVGYWHLASFTAVHKISTRLEALRT